MDPSARGSTSRSKTFLDVLEAAPSDLMCGADEGNLRHILFRRLFVQQYPRTLDKKNLDSLRHCLWADVDSLGTDALSCQKDCLLGYLRPALWRQHVSSYHACQMKQTDINSF